MCKIFIMLVFFLTLACNSTLHQLGSQFEAPSQSVVIEGEGVEVFAEFVSEQLFVEGSLTSREFKCPGVETLFVCYDNIPGCKEKKISCPPLPLTHISHFISDEYYLCPELRSPERCINNLQNCTSKRIQCRSPESEDHNIIFISENEFVCPDYNLNEIFTCPELGACPADGFICPKIAESVPDTTGPFDPNALPKPQTKFVNGILTDPNLDYPASTYYDVYTRSYRYPFDVSGQIEESCRPELIIRPVLKSPSGLEALIHQGDTWISNTTHYELSLNLKCLQPERIARVNYFYISQFKLNEAIKYPANHIYPSYNTHIIRHNFCSDAPEYIHFAILTLTDGSLIKTEYIKVQLLEYVTQMCIPTLIPAPKVPVMGY